MCCHPSFRGRPQYARLWCIISNFNAGLRWNGGQAAAQLRPSFGSAAAGLHVSFGSTSAGLLARSGRASALFHIWFSSGSLSFGYRTAMRRSGASQLRIGFSISACFWVRPVIHWLYASFAPDSVWMQGQRGCSPGIAAAWAQRSCCIGAGSCDLASCQLCSSSQRQRIVAWKDSSPLCLTAYTYAAICWAEILAFWPRRWLPHCRS